jgi:hypothetical protein
MNESPMAQEPKLISLGADVYGETSEYNGKTYVSIRRWFKADDGKWYRTKNGLHLRYDDMIEVLAHMPEFTAQVVEAQRKGEVSTEEEQPREHF